MSMSGEQRLDSILRSWLGTPWASGQCCRGRGVDCRMFVCAALDELYGIKTPKPARIPRDTGSNNLPAAQAMTRTLMERFPIERVASAAEFQPGDILIVNRRGASRAAMQHLMIVGVGTPTPVWHAGLIGVCYTALAGWTVAHAYRPQFRERWSTAPSL